jgi:hypothetical protein
VQKPFTDDAEDVSLTRRSHFTSGEGTWYSVRGRICPRYLIRLKNEINAINAITSWRNGPTTFRFIA